MPIFSAVLVALLVVVLVLGVVAYRRQPGPLFYVLGVVAMGLLTMIDYRSPWKDAARFGAVGLMAVGGFLDMRKRRRAEASRGHAARSSLA